MKPVRLAIGEDGNYKDDCVLITDVGGNMNSRRLLDRDTKEGVDVAEDIAIHCKVTNIGKFLSRFTLIVVACDCDEFYIASVSNSIRCFDKGEQWEFFAKEENLGYHDGLSFKNPNRSRTRGEITNSNGWHIKLYVIEEEEIGPGDDFSGSLGTIG